MAFPLVSLSLLLASQSFVFAAPTVDTNISSSQYLPEGYVAHPDIGVAYKIHKVENVTWPEARDNCTIEDAKLAVIDSPKKLEYAKLEPMGSGVRHVGIQLVGGNWISVTNESISTSTIPWAKGEGRTTADEYIRAMIGWADSYTALINGGDNFHGDFICEMFLQP